MSCFRWSLTNGILYLNSRKKLVGIRNEPGEKEEDNKNSEG